MSLAAGALDRFTDLLGPGHVELDAAALSAAETATYPTRTRVQAILRPGSAAEVAACVRLAGEVEIVLHPVSGGRNYGYGSRSPTADAALLDLGRLDRILDYDDRLGTVTIEAGVTFASLFAFLRARGAAWLAPATSGPPAGSVVANALERGVGTGPHADRVASVAALEVVLGDGRVLRTGFGGAGGRVAGLCRDGVGPSLDGLFFQSPLGVVTRATIWLAPMPEHLTVAFFRLDDIARLSPAIEALRAAAVVGVARPPLSIFNDVRLLSVVRGYPWAEALGRAPLSREARASLRREHGFGAFSGDVALHGASRAHARCLLDHLTEALEARVDGWEVIDADRAQLEALLAAPLGEHAFTGTPLRRALLLRHACVPQEAPLLQAYFRKPVRPARPGDLDCDGCGVVWCCPLLPFTGEDAERAVAIWEETATAHGFEPGLSLQALSPRCLHLIGSILWDRDAADADRCAVAAARALGERLCAAGYPPYRKPTLAMDGTGLDTGALDALRDIQRALDPGRVLASGRYLPR